MLLSQLLDSYQKNKSPRDLRDVQERARELENNFTTTFGKIDLMGSSRASRSNARFEPKPGDMNNVDLALDTMTKLTKELMGLNTIVSTTQTTMKNVQSLISSLQNSLVRIENRGQYQNQFQPRKRQDWEKSRAPKEPRVPIMLNTMSLVEQEEFAWCQPCQASCDEVDCLEANQRINEY